MLPLRRHPQRNRPPRQHHDPLISLDPKSYKEAYRVTLRSHVPSPKEKRGFVSTYVEDPAEKSVSNVSKSRLSRKLLLAILRDPTFLKSSSIDIVKEREFERLHQSVLPDSYFANSMSEFPLLNFKLLQQCVDHRVRVIGEVIEISSGKVRIKTSDDHEIVVHTQPSSTGYGTFVCFAGKWTSEGVLEEEFHSNLSENFGKRSFSESFRRGLQIWHCLRGFFSSCMEIIAIFLWNVEKRAMDRGFRGEGGVNSQRLRNEYRPTERLRDTRRVCEIL